MNVAKEREWVSGGLPAGAYEMLAAELPPSRLWSLLLELLQVLFRKRDA